MVRPGADARKEQYGQPRKHPTRNGCARDTRRKRSRTFHSRNASTPQPAATAISAALLIDAGRTTTVMSAAPQPSR